MRARLTTHETMTERLRALDACPEAIAWASRQHSFEAAWRACQRGDWMLWLAAKLDVDRRAVVLAACECARLALPCVIKGKGRPLVAIETAERWARGEATLEQVRAAAADADAAYPAAAAAAYAAAAAAAAYAAAAYAAAAADDADADDADADARRKTGRACATIVRRRLTARVAMAWKSHLE